MASLHKLALQSLQIGATETPPKLPEKEGHRNPPQVSGSAFRDTLSRDLTNGGQASLVSQSLVCHSGFVPLGKKVGGGTGDGGKLGEEQKQPCLPSNGPSSKRACC